MIYVVTGTRKLSEAQREQVLAFLETYNLDDQDEVYVGCAGGVDELVREHFSPDEVFRANWLAYGNRAGPMRNRKMLEHALERTCGDMETALVLAFPAKESKGTWDCVKQASGLGFRVHVMPVSS